jgi:rhodanese-related sulfurtransferase
MNTIIGEAAGSAINITLSILRQRLGKLPHGRDILVICRSDQRAYDATRFNEFENGYGRTAPAVHK